MKFKNPFSQKNRNGQDTDYKKSEETKKARQVIDKSDDSEKKIAKDKDIDDTGALPRGMIGFFNAVVNRDERYIKNYVSPSFWLGKADKINRLRVKRREDLSTYEQLSAGAQPTIEYYILILLSCIIATMGLIQGSTATIIGAMIVAPLMTPILAFSLGVVWGDVHLIKQSTASLVKGIFWAIVISTCITYLVPMSGYSREILARTEPTIFDIMVALASGLAGAYGNANKKISNTLVGIAIAVALMPPLCTIGIGLGTGNKEIASGAAVLFLINLVSIALAGAIVFWVMRIHPITANREGVARRAISQIIILVVILVFLSVPVVFFMREGYRAEAAEQELRQAITSNITGSSLFNLKADRDARGVSFYVTLSGEKEPDKEVLNLIIQKLRLNYHEVKDIKIQYFKSTQVLNSAGQGRDVVPGF